jgi:tetratricopeptide (TPR) repeat protein
MPKLGRNDPCPCGSGKKYKQCCLAADEAARLAAMPKATPPTQPPPGLMGLLNAFGAGDDGLEAASNIVPDLIKAGRLDEAETAAHDLLRRFPEVHDGYDRIGMVHEARGETLQAADAYRKAADFIRAHPDHYDPGYEELFDRLVAELDPPAADTPVPPPTAFTRPEMPT